MLSMCIKHFNKHVYHRHKYAAIVMQCLNAMSALFWTMCQYHSMEQSLVALWLIGEPPGTGTGTLLVHLTDLNDNMPYLVTKNTYICGNRDKGVEIEAKDEDVAPFGAPFTFSLRGEDKALKTRWKLDPDTGELPIAIGQMIIMWRMGLVCLLIKMPLAKKVCWWANIFLQVRKHYFSHISKLLGMECPFPESVKNIDVPCMYA